LQINSFGIDLGKMTFTLLALGAASFPARTPDDVCEYIDEAEPRCRRSSRTRQTVSEHFSRIMMGQPIRALTPMAFFRKRGEAPKDRPSVSSRVLASAFYTLIFRGLRRNPWNRGYMTHLAWDKHGIKKDGEIERQLV